MSDGSDLGAEATAEYSEQTSNSTDAESKRDTLISEVVPPEEGFIGALPGPSPNPIWSLPKLHNAPFLPVTFLGGALWDATVSEEARRRDRRPEVSSEFHSQYAGVPFALQARHGSAGEYVSYADFSVENGEVSR